MCIRDRTKPVDLLELSSVIRSLARRMRLAKSPRPADAETRAAAADTCLLYTSRCV